MRTIIAGSRTVTDYETVKKGIESIAIPITVVLCGEAKGPDKLGKYWASENNIPVESYPADWEKHGKGAGFIRNIEMVKNADVLIAFWDGRSKGTEHVIKQAKKYNLKVFIKFPHIRGI